MEQMLLVEFQTPNYTFRIILPDNYTQKQAREAMAHQLQRHAKQYPAADLAELQESAMNDANVTLMQIGGLYRDNEPLI